ncbi:hypothetical protein SAMD00020551_2399 [Mesobacillus selenatarsenatis SF-1]|uniref:Uncharacterized protein n=1 Tax=Mesobacillus selenatarsenatis (strain DSM 18680 / JCM 14380 / FERM P-15431 / SF-1) TaxID=1321606 RepID=A0A0A8X7X0_MESS1|nr:hypothetical protein SAMD00020551_2399 [Mesobacillus selenatarsenatis SF-1]
MAFFGGQRLSGLNKALALFVLPSYVNMNRNILLFMLYYI